MTERVKEGVALSGDCRRRARLLDSGHLGRSGGCGLRGQGGAAAVRGVGCALVWEMMFVFIDPLTSRHSTSIDRVSVVTRV
jgi:hypothetical protein